MIWAYCQLLCYFTRSHSQQISTTFFFSRHAQILAANNISQDKILNPKDLATMRAERIAKEKAQAVVAVSFKSIFGGVSFG